LGIGYIAGRSKTVKKMNELREWEKAHNYPNGALVLYTEDRKLMQKLKKKASGIQTYSDPVRDMAWDLIFPRTGDKKADYRLKDRLLAQCEET